MTKRKLTVNEMKTGVGKLPEKKLDFLGWTFGRSPKTGRAYIGIVPSHKRVVKLKRWLLGEYQRRRSRSGERPYIHKPSFLQPRPHFLERVSVSLFRMDQHVDGEGKRLRGARAIFIDDEFPNYQGSTRSQRAKNALQQESIGIRS